MSKKERTQSARTESGTWGFRVFGLGLRVENARTGKGKQFWPQMPPDTMDKL